MRSLTLTSHKAYRGEVGEVATLCISVSSIITSKPRTGGNLLLPPPAESDTVDVEGGPPPHHFFLYFIKVYLFYFILFFGRINFLLSVIIHKHCIIIFLIIPNANEPLHTLLIEKHRFDVIMRIASCQKK